MKTVVQIPHHEYPARVRADMEGRLHGLLHYYERIVSLRAVLERQSNTHRVELVANVGHHATLVVDARAGVLELAIDEALTRMRTILERHKGKRTDRRRRNGERTKP
jgi:ribosome-associated translation inhibitor RaiA